MACDRLSCREPKTTICLVKHWFTQFFSVRLSSLFSKPLMQWSKQVADVSKKYLVLD